MPIAGKFFWPLIFYALSGVVAIIAAYRILKSEIRYPGTESLASALIAAAAWVLSIAAGLVSPTLTSKLFWLITRYMSIALLSTALYITMNQYLHGKEWLTWRKLIILSIAPLLMTVLLLTNNIHHLFHPQISLAPYGPFQTLVTTYGIGMWLFLTHNIGLVLLSSIYIVSGLLQTRRTSSLRGILVLTGITVPIIVILVQISQANPFGYFSPVPTAIIFSAIISSYLLESARRQQLVRVSRSQLFETISDAVIILDHQKSRIIDMNTSAEDFLGSSISELIGQEITHAWPTYPSELQDSNPDSELENRIVVNRQGTECTYECKYIELQNWQNIPINYLLVIRDITTHAELEGQISTALQEKETLLREIHHRAKNNLQVISSMFNLQSALIKDPTMKDIFQESQDRIDAIALVHEQLYQTEGLQQINFAMYLRSMLDKLRRISSDDQLNVIIEIQQLADIHLTIDQATPCALIAYELVSDTQKKLLATGKPGKLSVSLQRQEDDRCVLVIRDHEGGKPEDADLQEDGKLSPKLVQALVSQIGGELTTQHQAGTTIEIAFPIKGESR